MRGRLFATLVLVTAIAFAGDYASDTGYDEGMDGFFIASTVRF